MTKGKPLDIPDLRIRYRLSAPSPFLDLCDEVERLRDELTYVKEERAEAQAQAERLAGFLRQIRTEARHRGIHVPGDIDAITDAILADRDAKVWEEARKACQFEAPAWTAIKDIRNPYLKDS